GYKSVESTLELPNISPRFMPARLARPPNWPSSCTSSSCGNNTEVDSYLTGLNKASSKPVKTKHPKVQNTILRPIHTFFKSAIKSKRSPTKTGKKSTFFIVL